MLSSGCLLSNDVCLLKNAFVCPAKPLQRAVLNLMCNFS